MREMLEPIFGETGALAAQFVITLIVVLVLVAVAYWLVRRYTGLRLGGIARGRVPRLAIVDAMAIDSRRRLVLVRRDNAEHLILIGGPSDILVEGPIRRVSARHRAEQLQASARIAATPPEPALEPNAFEPDAVEPDAFDVDQAQPVPTESPAPIPEPTPGRPAPARTEAPRPAPPLPPPPLPPRRSEGNGAAAVVAAPLTVQGEAEADQSRSRQMSGTGTAAADDHVTEGTSAQFAEIAHPTTVQQIGPPRDGVFDDTQAPAFLQADPAASIEDAPADDAAHATGMAAGEPAPFDAAGEGAQAAAEDDVIETGANPDEDKAANVTDLEREMTRLLGEIGTRRAT
jgi:flagellar biogenesis protein FliO